MLLKNKLDTPGALIWNLRTIHETQKNKDVEAQPQWHILIDTATLQVEAMWEA